MSISDQPLDVLLESALEIPDTAQRIAWIEKVCRNDPEKLEELMSLVESSQKPILLDTTLIEMGRAEQAAESLEGLSLEQFELLRHIGSGGMGAVYLARQRMPVSRLVAIKLIRQEFESQQILERFRSEQQILASMEHPNIARIIDAGTTDSGFMYIAMEYVHGEQLLDYCNRHGADIRSRILLLLQCCLAIQHAHQKGTIHRDIKPSNVMITLVDGEPVVKVIDFGIAKALVSESNYSPSEEENSVNNNASSALTQFGVSLGTPPYMSPEQYAIDTGLVDTRSDIYALGALMYTLLTGTPPFDPCELQGLPLRELRQLISSRDPQRPSQRAPQLAKQLRGDLDEIALKAMQRDVEQRYQSVGVLIEDLRSYLVGGPVRANPESTWKGIHRFAKRNKLLLTAGSLAIAGLLIGLIVSILQERRASISELRARRQAYASDMLLSSMAIARGNYVLPKEILERQHQQPSNTSSQHGSLTRARFDWRILASQIPEEPRLLAQFPSKIYFGVELPDRNEVASGCKDSHLRVIDSDSGLVRLDIDTQQREINGLAVSPDGRTIASGGDDGTVRFYDIATGMAIRTVQVSATSVFQVAWTSDGAYFVTVGDEANARVWKFSDFELVQTLDSAGESLECLGVSRQGQIAFGSENGILRIASFSEAHGFKVQTVSASLSRVFHVDRCSSIAFSPSGHMLAVGLDNGYLILMIQTEDTFQIVERIQFPTTVTALTFNRDESRLAIGENNGSVHELQLPEAWPTHSRFRFSKYFFDRNARLFAEGERTPERLWELVSRTDPPGIADEIPLDTDQIYLEFNTPIEDIAFPDNYMREWVDATGQTRPSWTEIPESIIYRGDGIELKFKNRYSSWSNFKSLESQGRLVTWTCHSRRVSSLVWRNDETGLESMSEDGSVKLLPRDSTHPQSIGGQDVTGLMPLQGDRLVLMTLDHEPSFLRLDAGREEPILMAPVLSSQESYMGVVARDEKTLYFSRRDPTDPSSTPRTIYQWAAESNRVDRIASLPESIQLQNLVAATPNGRLILTYEDTSNAIPKGSRYYGLICFDLDRDIVRWKLPSESEEPKIAKLSPKGAFLAYAKDRNRRSVYMVDVQSGREQTLEDFKDLDILAISFSTDDKYLTVSLSNNSIVCFRTSDGTRAWTLNVPGSAARDMVWSIDKTTLACVGLDGYLRMFDTDLRVMTGEVLLSLKSPMRLRTSPEEDWLYVLDRGGSLIRIPCHDRFFRSRDLSH